VNRPPSGRRASVVNPQAASPVTSRSFTPRTSTSTSPGAVSRARCGRRTGPEPGSP
jgi:hypothetical protein